MTNRMGFLAAAGLAASAMVSPANAALQLVGQFRGNECSGGGFATCYAYQNGTTSQGNSGGGSPTIFKKNSDGSTALGNFSSITGSEFSVNYVSNTNTLSFTYMPGANDPVIHYVAVNNNNYTYLFYDAGPVTSGSFALNTFSEFNPGWSHITFFDTGSGAVPEPATWAMMIGGFGAIGASLRRRRRTKVSFV